MSSTAPSICIVVPNYNHAKYIERCLTAIVTQSLLPDEVIVIDDASTDDSAKVVDEFSRKHPLVQLHRNSTNQGVVYNLNLGLKMTKADYVLFAAADDSLLPGFMEQSSKLLEKFPHAALSCTVGDWVEEHTGLNWHVGVGMGDKPCFIPPAEVCELERQGKLFIASHSAIFRKEPLAAIGGFIPGMKWNSDWFAFTVLSLRHGLCFIPEPLSRQYIFKTSFSAAGRKTAEHEKSLQLLLDYLISPEYADVASMIQSSGALFIFGPTMLKLLLTNRSYRRFLNFIFLRKNLWHTTKVRLKQFTPSFVGNLYFKFSGYRAKSADAPTNTVAH